MRQSIYRLKFSYTGEKENGDLTKKKLELLAQCANYTDAEKLVNAIIERGDYSRYGECAYEIVKTKYFLSNVLLNDAVAEEDKVLCGLSESYFEDEQAGFFVLKVKEFAKNEEDKDTTEEFIIPALTSAAADKSLKEYLRAKYDMASDMFKVISNKLDNADSIFMLPEVVEAKRKPL